MAGVISLTENSANNPRVNPEGVTDDDSHLKRQLKAGERILTQVRHEKNNLQDANIRLDVELKDVRAQLADSVMENKRLHYSITVSAQTNYITVRRGSVLKEFCL